MTTNDLSDIKLPPRPVRRPIPCAGLFGWRKDSDDKSSRAEANEPMATPRGYLTD